MIPTVAGRFATSHRRYDPLRDEWVLVAPGRTRRPWSGALEPHPDLVRPEYDPDCYLCPGNARAGGAVNPRYRSTYVFTNDFAALTPGDPTEAVSDGLLAAEGVAGTCRVVCFSPRHDVSLTDLSPAAVREVVDTWADQTTQLGREYRWVQVFENRGAGMGASNLHAHGQIWATNSLPVEATREQRTQGTYLADHGSRLLSDYRDQETGGERSVLENEQWLVVVPFWAAWPFEIMLLPKSAATRLADLDECGREGLAQAMLALLARYDGLFGVPIPYSMGWHQAPFEDAASDGWLLHAHYYPPLLRSATVRKFMVGYELLAERQRDFTPEEAAARLRSGRRRVATRRGTRARARC